MERIRLLPASVAEIVRARILRVRIANMRGQRRWGIPYWHWHGVLLLALAALFLGPEKG